MLPDSSGGFDEVLVVADDGLLNKFVKPLLKEEFTKAYDVLPQGETALNPLFVAYKNFDGTFLKFRTVFIVADLSQQSQITDYVIETLGEDITTRALNDPDKYYVIANDAWAKPQRIFFVFAPTEEALKERLSVKAESLSQLALQYETNRYKLDAYAFGEEITINKLLKEEYKLNLGIPKTYFVATKNDTMIWLRKETNKTSTSIMISFYPKSAEFTNKGIPARNALGRDYVSTAIEGAYMTTDSTLGFVTQKRNIGELPTYITRGLWATKGDFMGGPFVSYYMQDVKNDREILIDVFIHAPGTKKKPEVRRLEAIVSTARTL